MMAEQLAYSPPTKVIRVQSPAGSLQIFACGNCAGRCHWSVGFLGDLQFPSHFHSGAPPYSPQSPLSTLKTSIIADCTKRRPIMSHTCFWGTGRVIVLAKRVDEHLQEHIA
ncbi:hypothetical protein PR048_013590 [Dryococelus australis]|uniref:Uncharacterized protein n=1 Tax=Dryococelus australis TaxID=614101 RepID=A0ABQ9HSX4_9NEOP|nr:hypothetical protein PR048_013590 [Dryococelus australis]